MNLAAGVFAAMLIAQPLLVSASISTSTSAEIQLSGSTVASCTNAGVTVSTCSAALNLPQTALNPQASVGVAATSTWNSFAFQYSTSTFAGLTIPTVIAASSGTVNDVVTAHGGAGSAVLVLNFVGTASNGFVHPTIRVNGNSIPLGNVSGGVSFPVEVPFVFDVPFALTFGVDESVTNPAEFEQTGDAFFMLGQPHVYTRSPFLSGQEIPGVSFVRESGADLGVPEPASVLLCAFGLLAVLTRRIRR